MGKECVTKIRHTKSKCSGVSSSSNVNNLNTKYVNVNMIRYVHLHELNWKIYMLVYDKTYNGIISEVRAVLSNRIYHKQQ